MTAKRDKDYTKNKATAGKKNKNIKYKKTNIFFKWIRNSNNTKNGRQNDRTITMKAFRNCPHLHCISILKIEQKCSQI